MNYFNSSELESDKMLSVSAVVVFTCLVTLSYVIQLGNLLTIISYLLQRRLRRAKYIPVVSLAVSDLLYGLSASIYLIERYSKTGSKDHKAVSLFSMIIIGFLSDTSALHLIVLAVDRLVAVRYPMSYRGMMTSRCITKMTIGCWLIACLINCHYLMWISIDAHSVTDRNVTCYQYESNDGPVPLAFDFAIQFSVYATVTTCLTALSIGVLFVAKTTRLQHHRQSINVEVSLEENHSTIHGARLIGSRAYTMVTVIVVTYIVTWAPYFILQILRLTSMPICRAPIARTAHLITGGFAGSINAGNGFIVYALVNRDFRFAYKSTMRKMLTCGKSTPPACVDDGDEFSYPGRRSHQMSFSSHRQSDTAL